jgi:hypothetical protein
LTESNPMEKLKELRGPRFDISVIVGRAPRFQAWTRQQRSRASDDQSPFVENEA